MAWLTHDWSLISSIHFPSELISRCEKKISGKLLSLFALWTDHVLQTWSCRGINSSFCRQWKHVITSSLTVLYLFRMNWSHIVQQNWSVVSSSAFPNELISRLLMKLFSDQLFFLQRIKAWGIIKQDPSAINSLPPPFELISPHVT